MKAPKHGAALLGTGSFESLSQPAYFLTNAFCIPCKTYYTLVEHQGGSADGENSVVSACSCYLSPMR
jgi:hypothetical protein